MSGVGVTLLFSLLDEDMDFMKCSLSFGSFNLSDIRDSSVASILARRASMGYDEDEEENE